MDQTGRHGQATQLEEILSQKVIKRSVSIAGHTTSVSLEQVFWDELNRLAKVDDISISTLIEIIDDARSTNLSSALRLYVMHKLQLLADADNEVQP
jgi:predicted DNA-binding ribbon-helix-helix protein